MAVKHLVGFFLLYSMTNIVLADKESTQWHLLGKGKINGISGIAAIDDEHFLIVHDRKKKDEPRLSIAQWQKWQTPVSSSLNWCDMANMPIDLEAITALPNAKKRYLVLESKGKVTQIQLADDNASCAVISKFELPNASADSNMEGIALHCQQDKCVLVWAERGDEKTPAKVSWTSFDISKNKLGDKVNTFEFNAPFPQVNQRSISDIAINASGNVWVSSVSDPSDIGTFYSAVYELGKFAAGDDKMVWEAAAEVKTIVKYEYDNVKIEGLTFTADSLIMGSEDEILGGKIAGRLLK